MSAEAQIKAFIERIIRLKDEQDAIGEDIKAVYAEAKSLGFDKTGLGDVVTHLRKIEKKGADTIAEKEAIFDMYLSAYRGPQARASARTREIIEEFDPITGEFVSDAAPTSAAVVMSSSNDTAKGEAGSPAGLPEISPETAVEMQHPGSHLIGNPEPALAAANRPNGDDGTVRMARTEAAAVTDRRDDHLNHEMDRAGRTTAEPNNSMAAENARKAGPGRADGSVTHAGAGESPATIDKPKSRLRPNCLQPEMCRSGTRDHCYSCRKSMAHEEEFA